ncbi:MAG TPA: hypothetical protein VNJ12_05185 [Candidatus Dormibacteraeota bacterium]|nr:hypothetical protein [Candidatus Dormibacteraeota bacterium]
MRLIRIRLDRIESDVGLRVRLNVFFGARAVRCDFCRHNFASWRLLGSAEEESVESHLEEDVRGAQE